MSQPNIVILAAGKGKRMHSKRPKVLHEIMGKPMIEYVVEGAKELSPSKIVVVTGHEKELVEERLKEAGLSFAAQEEQKGTAHALLTAEPMIGDGRTARAMSWCFTATCLLPGPKRCGPSSHFSGGRKVSLS